MQLFFDKCEGVAQSDLSMGIRLCELGVKKMMVDFGAEMTKPRSSGHSSIFDEWAVSV